MTIKYSLATEKAIRKMESDNALLFIVDKKDNKKKIKKMIETTYDVKVINVKTMIDCKNRKKAYVKFDSSTPAMDLATKLKLM